MQYQIFEYVLISHGFREADYIADMMANIRHSGLKFDMVLNCFIHLSRFSSVNHKLGWRGELGWLLIRSYT